MVSCGKRCSAQDVPERDSTSVRCVFFFLSLSLSLESGAVTIMREMRSSSDRLLASALSPARMRAHDGTTGAWSRAGHALQIASSILVHNLCRTGSTENWPLDRCTKNRVVEHPGEPSVINP